MLLSSKMTSDSSMFLTIVSNIFFWSTLDLKFSTISMLTYCIILRMKAMHKKPTILIISNSGNPSKPFKAIAMDTPPTKTQMQETQLLKMVASKQLKRNIIVNSMAYDQTIMETVQQLSSFDSKSAVGSNLISTILKDRLNNQYKVHPQIIWGICLGRQNDLIIAKQQSRINMKYTTLLKIQFWISLLGYISCQIMKGKPAEFRIIQRVLAS